MITAILIAGYLGGGALAYAMYLAVSVDRWPSIFGWGDRVFGAGFVAVFWPLNIWAAILLGWRPRMGLVWWGAARERGGADYRRRGRRRDRALKRAIEGAYNAMLTLPLTFRDREPANALGEARVLTASLCIDRSLVWRYGHPCHLDDDGMEPWHQWRARHAITRERNL